MFAPRKSNEFECLGNAMSGMPQDASGLHALDTWESEGGGSPAEALEGIGPARSAFADNAGWLASNNIGWLMNAPAEHTPKGDDRKGIALAEDEDHILRCLGAAVIMRWNTIPTKLQKELFDNATSMGDLLQADTLKGQIARFLHRHKNDA